MPVLLYSVGSTQTNPIGNMIYERVSVDGLKEKASFYMEHNPQPTVLSLLSVETNAHTDTRTPRTNPSAPQHAGNKGQILDKSNHLILFFVSVLK